MKRSLTSSLRAIWTSFTNGPLALVFVLAVAAVLRLYRIDTVPPGMHFDEAFNIADVLDLLRGQFAVFFPANYGREPLYFYVSLVGGSLFGTQALTLRLTSAIVGTATVLVVYTFARALFRSRRIGLLTAFLMAISVWHIYYSRIGLRVILAVPLALLALFWFWRGMQAVPASARVTSWRFERPFILSGLFAALTVYAYTSGRFLPVILIVLTVTCIVTNRARWRQYLGGLAITGSAAMVAFLPLGAYFINHPKDFFEHGSNLSILDPRVNRGDLWGTLVSNTQAVAGMFFLRGDKEAFRNVPLHPVFDPLLAILFLVGLVLLLVALFSRKSLVEERRRAVLIAASLAVFVVPSVLSDAPPNFTRTLLAAPILMLLPAWSLDALWDRWHDRDLGKRAAFASAAILLISSTLAINDYFVQFASSPALYYAFEVRMFDVAQWINQNARTSQIFMAPLWYQNGTLALLTRDAHLKSFESRDTVILPPAETGKDALYAFPMEQEQKAAKLGERLGALGTREIVTGSTGEQLLVVYRVKSADLPHLESASKATATPGRAGDFLQPEKSVSAVWGDSLELLGYTTSPEGPGGRNLTVTLLMRAIKPPAHNYTFSIKVRDDKGRAWGQEDKWPGDNSYATGQWSPGEVIAEKFYPGLNACAPAGLYHITVEVYDPKTMQGLALMNGDGNGVSLGSLTAGPSQGNRLEDLEIAEPLNIDVAPQAHLIGLTLSSQEARAGDPVSLSLFWQGLGDGSVAREASIQVMDAAKRVFTIGSKSVTLPVEGRGLCTLVDWTVPRDAAAGTAEILVNNSRIANLGIVR